MIFTKSAAGRVQLIQAAGIISLTGNLLLAALKLAAGIFGKSLAVTGDGFDSAADAVISLVTVIVGKIINHPSDREHPWGHGRAETTATMILSFIIALTGFQLALSAVRTLISDSPQGYPETVAVIAMLISIAGKTALAFSQYAIGKRANSAIILANAQNMKNDIVISFSVLAGTCATRIFGMAFFDPIAALLVSLWIIKNAVMLFMEANMELMDGNADKELYNRLFEAVRRVPGAANPHRARIRKIADKWDITLDIEINPAMTVHAAHEITEKVEAAARDAIPDIYDIVVHIEPAGHKNHHPQEQYGLSEQDID
ncbi:MAG: cation diffusion facilitator family transporter [Bacteroides sp.]|nr:cation diffusion facilitator family transporter [Prevotella sp.]MCM1407453.1 cation diffusion facilitator family transporter [Treponema brennaborense]MCM1469943.1 cation diffusion facilitator family transporter [Bacteroides sp.]